MAEPTDPPKSLIRRFGRWLLKAQPVEPKGRPTGSSSRGSSESLVAGGGNRSDELRKQSQHRGLYRSRLSEGG